MKKKDLEKIADVIVKAEQVINDKQADPSKVKDAKAEIWRVSGKVQSLEDMMLLDDLIQEKLKKS